MSNACQDQRNESQDIYQDKQDLALLGDSDAALFGVLEGAHTTQLQVILSHIAPVTLLNACHLAEYLPCR